MPATIQAYIRRADRGDLDTIVEWMEDPDFQRFLYGDPARSPKQIREQIVGMLGRTGSQALPQGIYFIIDGPKGPMGILSLQAISWRNRTCSIDLYLGRKEARAGLVAAIAFLRAMQYAFDELNMYRVSAFIYSFNKASWRIMEHSGAKREVVLKDHVSRDGEFYDMYCYGLLRPEYEALRARYAEKYPSATLEKMVEMLQQESGSEAQEGSA